ncbi:PIN domain-like protein [Trametes maxima]|nr:PIN domain-like protein [Trametes maxima]
MGVPGLWDILRPAGQRRVQSESWGNLGLRIGIDVSLWFYHASQGRGGENPELRTLFFRCTRLMSMPFLPLFLFDGPGRPKIKRGKHTMGRSHWLTSGMKEFIAAFGFEWREAPGEAEAELAYLNKIGVIDAILSDDVDAFLFGALTVIRNPSPTLAGNKRRRQDDPKDDSHSLVYRSTDIQHHDDIQLTRGGLILVGILQGGDYCEQGLRGCGVSIAHGLARCGLGDSLLDVARTKTRHELEAFLAVWRDELRRELRTNKHGYLPRNYNKLTDTIPESFPDINVVLAYAIPVTSETRGRPYIVDWNKQPDFPRITALCATVFQWEDRVLLLERFRTVLWPLAVFRILRYTLVTSTSTSTLDDLLIQIHSSRRHRSTDNILEYRLEISPAILVRLCNLSEWIDETLETTEPQSFDSPQGGSNEERKRTTSNEAKHPGRHMKIWLPACIVEAVNPGMVETFERSRKSKQVKHTARWTKVPVVVAE